MAEKISENIKAKDVMQRATPVINFDTTVPDAIQFFKTHNSGFAIVQASADRFHGVLTEGSLMRVYLRYLSQPTKETIILYRDLLEPAQLIHEKEPLAEIIKKIVTAISNRVFVINDKTEVVGYITVQHILPYLKIGPASSTLAGPSSQVQDLYLYENFFTQSPFMMHSVNRSGDVQMANLILHKALGYEFGELVGKAVFTIYPKEAAAKVQQSLNQIIEQGNVKVVRGQMIHKNGKSIEVEMCSRALTDQSGMVIGTVTVSRPLDMEYLLSCLPQM